MNWKVGQKVAALCDIAIHDYDDTWIENVIEFDEVYHIISIETLCCYTLLDLGKTYNGKRTTLIYQCEKCKKEYSFKENETILFDEKCFRPIDENESKLAKAVRKITNLIRKKKKAIGFLRIKIRTPIVPPFLEPEPRPIPKREVEVQPKWEEELV